MALASHAVKTFWAQWRRLQIKDGLLKRRFESPDGLSIHWQWFGVLPFGPNFCVWRMEE